MVSIGQPAGVLNYVWDWFIERGLGKVRKDQNTGRTVTYTRYCQSEPIDTVNLVKLDFCNTVGTAESTPLPAFCPSL